EVPALEEGKHAEPQLSLEQIERQFKEDILKNIPQEDQKMVQMWMHGGVPDGGSSSSSSSSHGSRKSRLGKSLTDTEAVEGPGSDEDEDNPQPDRKRARLENGGGGKKPAAGGFRGGGGFRRKGQSRTANRQYSPVNRQDELIDRAMANFQ